MNYVQEIPGGDDERVVAQRIRAGAMQRLVDASLHLEAVAAGIPLDTEATRMAFAELMRARLTLKRLDTMLAAMQA